MIGALMYRIPTDREILHMESNFPLVVLENEPITNNFKLYTIVRKYMTKTKTCFFKFEGKKSNDVLSIFQLECGADAHTGNETWDETNRILAVNAIVSWAKSKNVKEIIVHTHDIQLFEVLWDADFIKFTLTGYTNNSFSACGIKNL